MPPEETQSEQVHAFSARVFDTLEKRNLKPLPRWHFLFHEWVVYGIAVIAFVVGSVATALSIFIAHASRFMEYSISQSTWDVAFDMIPFVWLVLLILALFYGTYAVRHFRAGYRYHVSWVVVGAIVASVVGGSCLFAAGAGEAIDRYLIANVSLYGPMAGFRPMHWMRPGGGVVAGTIAACDQASQRCQVNDLAGATWEVRISSSSIPHEGFDMHEGMMVRIFGTSTSEGTFNAFEIRRFEGRGGMHPRMPMLAPPPVPPVLQP